MPQPVSDKFNLFRLQWFPGYPLTNKAIEDGHIKEEDASIEKLIKRTSNDWAYVPTLEMIQNKKTKLTNVIWLIVWGHTNENIVKYSVFSDSIGSKLCLQYLNYKALLFGKVVGVGESIGTVYALLGEGIIPSMQCVDIFLENMHDFKAYEKAIEKYDISELKIKNKEVIKNYSPCVEWNEIAIRICRGG